MSQSLSEARQYLANAQRELREAGTRVQAEHDHHQKIVAIRDRPKEIEHQIADAQTQHSQQLVQWAASGASGEAPSPPAVIETLAKKLAAATREAAAAETAAQQHETKLKTAQDEANAALRRMRERRRDVLLECAQPYIEEFQTAVLRVEALYQHLQGLSAATRDNRYVEDEVPVLGRVTGRIADALRFKAQLVPGGALQSRETWRRLIAELADNPSAQLGDAPQTVDCNSSHPQRA